MTFSTPRRLTGIAAKIFVEKVILDSEIFLNLFYSKDAMSRGDHDPNCPNRENIEVKLLELRKRVDGIIKMINKIFAGCNKKVMECILQELRTTDFCCSGALVLQLLLDSEINFSRKHWQVFPIVLVMKQSFPTIEKLIFETNELNSPAFLSQLIKYLPNLKVFKGSISNEDNCLTALRRNCSKINELCLYIKEGFLTSDQLTSFFFCGKQLDNVKRAYVKLEALPLSFPDLKSFSINSIEYEQYDFFKMFLHFYINVNFHAGLQYSPFHSHSVSWFDAVLSHSVVINPELCVSQCELNVHDLYLPFCEKSLYKWKNLEGIVISIGIQGKKSPTTSTNIGKKLESLIMQLQNVRDFCIKVQGPVSDDEISEIVLPSLKSQGKRLRQLQIVGVLHYLSHRSLVQAVNFCPNLQHLILIGKRITRYFKDVKPIKLHNLESLTVLWSESQTNNAFCQWISKFSCDLIKNSPNIKKLFLTANLFLLEHICKVKFGSELQTFIIYFHTEKPTDGVDYIKKLLPNLPTLQQLIVKKPSCTCFVDVYEVDEVECSCEDLQAFSAVRNMVENTQVYVRYCSLEDVGTQIGLFL